jgi:hypothetical protein
MVLDTQPWYTYMTQHPQNIPAQECPCAKVQMTQGGKRMTQVYHSFFPSLRSNHNENMLLLIEGDIWYPEVVLAYVVILKAYRPIGLL